MKTIAPAVLLLLAGCASGPAGPTGLSATRSRTLEKMLVPQFDVATVPAQYRADFYAVLDIFARGRRPDEFVLRAEFALTGEITLYFSNSGMHGGGFAIFRRQNGQWIEDKGYFA